MKHSVEDKICNAIYKFVNWLTTYKKKLDSIVHIVCKNSLLRHFCDIKNTLLVRKIPFLILIGLLNTPEKPPADRLKN